MNQSALEAKRLQAVAQRTLCFRSDSSSGGAGGGYRIKGQQDAALGVFAKARISRCDDFIRLLNALLCLEILDHALQLCRLQFFARKLLCLPLTGGEEALFLGIELTPMLLCPPCGFLKTLAAQQVFRLLPIGPYSRRLGERVLNSGPPAPVRLKDGLDPTVVRKLVPGKLGTMLNPEDVVVFQPPHDGHRDASGALPVAIDSPPRTYRSDELVIKPFTQFSLVDLAIVDRLLDGPLVQRRQRPIDVAELSPVLLGNGCGVRRQVQP